MQSKKIVILGAGFAGMYAAREIAKNGLSCSITIINRTNYFLFTPMLHEVATAGLDDHQVVESVREITRGSSISFVQGDIREIDVANKVVRYDGGSYEYDALILALGSTTNFYDTPGAAEHALVLKSLADAIAIRERIVTMFDEAAREKDPERRRRLLSFVVVGGGATGVEIVAEIADLCNYTMKKYYPKEFCRGDVHITLVNAGPELLPVFNPKIRAYAYKTLTKNGIAVELDARITEVAPDEVVFSSGSCLPAGTVVWAAGTKAVQVAMTGGELPKDGGGRIMTDETFRVDGYPDIFAVGDVAHVKEESGRGYPMLAQVATQQAEVLGENIARLCRNEPLKKFSYSPKGELVSLGRGEAAGLIYGVFIYGKLAWFIWRTVYLFKFISGSKRLRIALEWTLQLFYPRDISRA